MQKFLLASLIQVFVWQISGHLGGQLELIFREKLTKIVHKEYFAECTEAYFARNDFYPFTREELKKHDQKIHDLMGNLWGASSK